MLREIPPFLSTFPNIISLYRRRLCNTGRRSVSTETLGRKKRVRPKPLPDVKISTLYTPHISTPLLWSRKHSPKFKDELTISGVKLQEIKHALETYNCLVIEGPSASGKLSAVHILSNELRYHISEWDVCPNSMGIATLSETFIKFLSCRSIGIPFDKLCHTVFSHSNTLENHRYLNIILNYCVRHHTDRRNETLKRHVLLVKEFPHSLFQVNRRYSSDYPIVRCIQRIIETLSLSEKKKTIIVFIFNDSNFDRSALQLLFPKKLRDSCEHIKIPSVSVSGLKKITKRILMAEEYSTYFLQRVLDYLNTKKQEFSDITSYLTYLQFVLVPYFSKVLPSPKSRILNKTHYDTPALSDDCIHSHLPDHKDDIMHAVGRMLWNKRLNITHLPNTAASPFFHLTCPSSPVSSGINLNRLSIFSANYLQISEEKNITTQYQTLLKQLSWQPPNLPGDPTQLSFRQHFPKLLRCPSYFNVDDLLDGILPDLHIAVDLLYSNYLYFYGAVNDASELMNQFTYSDAFLRSQKKCGDIDNDSTANIVCCKAVLDSNLHPTSPREQAKFKQLSPRKNEHFFPKNIRALDPESEEIVDNANSKPSFSKPEHTSKCKSFSVGLFKFHKSRISEIKLRRESAGSLVIREFLRASSSLPPHPSVISGYLLSEHVYTELLPWLQRLKGKGHGYSNQFLEMSELLRQSLIQSPVTWMNHVGLTSIESSSDQTHELEIDETDLEPFIEDEVENTGF